MSKRPNSIGRLAASALLAFIGTHASAAVDSNYYVAEAVAKGPLEVFNDGKNTFIQAVSGLVVRGATADGERFIVKGVPSQIPAQLNGKQITVIRGYPPAQPVPKPVVLDAKTVMSKIEQLSSDIKRIESISGVSDQASVAADVASGAPMDEEWVVPHGGSMRDVVTQFAVRAGWIVDINFNDAQTGQPRDLIFSGGKKIVGTFKTAIREAFSSLPETSSVMAELRPDNSPPTLFIYRKGSQK